MSYAKPVHPKPADSNGPAVAGFILSLLGLILFPPLMFVGLVFCWIGMRKEPKGLAIAGMIISLVGFILWVIIGVLVFSAVAAPVMCCIGFSSAAYQEMADQVKDEYENHPVVVEQLGGIESVDLDLSAASEYRDPGTTVLVYQVEGPKGDGEIIVKTDLHSPSQTTTVTLRTDEGEWELKQSSGLSDIESSLEIDRDADY